MREWWRSHELTSDSFSEFVNSIPPEFRRDMLARFIGQFQYVSDISQGNEFVRQVLSDNGIFADGNLLQTEVGADFFLQLAIANPEAALRVLSRTLGSLTCDQLLQFTTGRRQVIFALEEIAVYEQLFADASELLLLLAEAENETWSNNATGVFCGLFGLGLGEVAPTEASPAQRFPVLEETLQSDSEKTRQIGLKACDKALESFHFSRSISGSARVELSVRRWHPSSMDEVSEALERVWTLAVRLTQSSLKDERDEAVNILLKRADGLVRFSTLAPMVLSTLSELVSMPIVTNKRVLISLSNIVRYRSESMNSKVMGDFQTLIDTLTGEGFAGDLRRYVGMNLLDDEFDEQGNRIDLVERKHEELCHQALADPALLTAYLAWLTTQDAERSGPFGYQLGKDDTEHIFLDSILDAQRNGSEQSSFAFLGGYLRSVREQDPVMWDNILEHLVSDPELHRYLPEITWRSGMNDAAMNRVLKLFRNGEIDLEQLAIFEYGDALAHLSEAVFTDLIELILASDSNESKPIALSLFHRYYDATAKLRVLPKELTFRVLTYSALPGNITSHHNLTVMHNYHWTTVGQAFARIHRGACP